MYLIIDCETTGLPKRRSAPVTDTHNWPRVVQVAWMLYDESEELKERASHLVRPNGFTIPREAQRVHGITTERAEVEGRPLSFVLKELSVAAGRSKVVVAHNLDFDYRVICAEYVHLGLPLPFNGKARVCTMKGSADFCRIPGPRGYKWPKLPELHHALFGRRCEETHDAA
ncbi:MAG TPA: 3'-5' exonuclease, partial [Clostridiales bacterium]|nr:3'-5' exonuclease [Clostridiales bacterium]